MSTGAYIFDGPYGREAEQTRLERQAALFDPVTERVFQAAGIAPGMRVLDLGAGAGDVSMLAARIVGPAGHVVGIERNPDAIRSAQERMRRAGIGNVSFVEGDVATFEFEDTFDAVVGRLILMYVPDPAVALGHAARLLRPGGIVCVHEINGAELAAPDTPLFAEVSRLICTAFERTGAAIHMADRLHSVFRAAGLAAPELRYERVAGGPEQRLTEYIRDLLILLAPVIASLTPVIERERLATAEQLELKTLVARLDAELERTGGIVTLWPMIGAWCTV
jgi:SAM-dependent methyltransferase